MKKVYLVYMCEYNKESGIMEDNIVVNVFSNKKKAENYKKWKDINKNGENKFYYIIPMRVETYNFV